MCCSPGCTGCGRRGAPQIIAAVTADLDAERAVAAKERRRLAAAKSRLDAERTLLLQAHYAGAIPLDLLKAEQNRISRELGTITERLAATAVEFDPIAANLDRVLALAGDWHQVYRAAAG